MYRGHYDKPTPPGYSGVAFAKSKEERRENPPTPVENGAGETNNQNAKPSVGTLLGEILKAPPSFFKASADRRNEIKALPRNFSGTSEESPEKEKQQAVPTAASPQKSDNKELYARLSSFFGQKFSIEELLLIGTALLLATKEENDEAFPVFALALLFLGS